MATLKFTSMALQELCPGATWSLQNEDYDKLEWTDTVQQKPSKEAVVAKAIELAGIIEYRNSRRKEYPPIQDYIDGVVKGDQEQIDAYIAACQAVKLKYPKPE
jgi:hypothetical protein